MSNIIALIEKDEIDDLNAQMMIQFFNRKNLGKNPSNRPDKLLGSILFSDKENGPNSNLVYKNTYINLLIDNMTTYDIYEITGLTLFDLLKLDHASYELLINKMTKIKEESKKMTGQENVIAEYQKTLKQLEKKMKQMRNN